MAEQALITGLLALLAFAVFVGVLVGVILYVGQFEEKSSLHTESERVRCYGLEKEGRPGTKTEDDLSPKGRQTFFRRWNGTRKHAKRDASTRRLRAAVPIFGLILGAFLAPTFAFADDGGNVWGPQVLGWDDGNVMGVMTVAENKYNAALFALGYDPNDSDTFNEVVKAKLSNESTGSSFYTFAQLFETGQPTWFPNYENVSGVYFTVVTLYGAERVYSARYETVHALQARVALEAILNGGGSGGGGTSGPITEGNYIYFPVQAWAPNPPHQTSYIRVNLDAYNVLLNYANGFGFTEDDIICFWGYQNGDVNHYYGSLIFTSSDNYELRESNSFNRTYNIQWLGGRICGFNRAVYSFSNVEGFGEVFTISGSGTATAMANASDVTHPTFYYGTGSGVVQPDIPETNWPVPVGPHIWQAPQLPEPTMPIPPDPVDEPIYAPVPTMPIPSPEDGPTYTTADLSAVLDAMNEHCIHLQTAIYGATNRVWLLLSQKVTNDLETFTTWLGSWFGTFLSDFDAGIGHLESYLHSLAEWLAEQFDYTFTSSAYDDGSIVAWLKKIWAKLGTGTVNTRPDDPVADPIGIGNWLGTLFDNLISTLMGLGAELLGGISDDLDTLTGKFPFSIPWDIAAILVLFVADPVTPVVEFPWYTVTMDGLQSTPIVVDCSPYDSYMVVVRTVELAIFGAGLAWRTKDVMDVLSSVGGDG